MTTELLFRVLPGRNNAGRLVRVYPASRSAIRAHDTSGVITITGHIAGRQAPWTGHLFEDIAPADIAANRALVGLDLDKHRAALAVFAAERAEYERKRLERNAEANARVAANERLYRAAPDMLAFVRELAAMSTDVQQLAPLLQIARSAKALVAKVDGAAS